MKRCKMYKICLHKLPKGFQLEIRTDALLLPTPSLKSEMIWSLFLPPGNSLQNSKLTVYMCYLILIDRIIIKLGGKTLRSNSRPGNTLWYSVYLCIFNRNGVLYKNIKWKMPVKPKLSVNLCEYRACYGLENALRDALSRSNPAV